jgi:hypothetical protein
MVTFLNARAVETDFNTNRVYTEKALVPTEDLVKLRREIDDLLKDGTKVNALDAPVHTVRDVMELIRKFYRGGGGAGSVVSLTDNLDGTFTLTVNGNTTTYDVLAYAGGGGGGGTVDTVVAGAGVSVNSADPANPIVTNTAPDQTVVLTGGTDVDVVGTYPNFTINYDGAGAGVAPTDGTFLVGNGTAFVGEIGATARTSIGLGTTDAVSFATLDTSGPATLGNSASSMTQLTVRGGSSGGPILALARTAGTTATFSFALAGGGLSFSDLVAGQVVANLFGNTSMNELYIGNKAFGTASNRPALLSSTTQTSAAGADLPGNDLNLQGAGGTGAGVPGDVVIKTATALASGTTAQTAIERVVVLGGSGNMGVGTSVPARKVDVIGDIGATTGIRITGATGVLGYATGTGSAVTQLTSKSTAVTINTPTGTITTHNASLGANTEVSFVVNNSLITVNDCVVVTLRATAGVPVGEYAVVAGEVGNGRFAITLSKWQGSALGHTLNINYAIICAASS